MSDYVPTPDMVDFFNGEIAPYIMPLLNDSYQLPVIQKAHNEDVAAVQAAYGHALHVDLCDKPPFDSAGEKACLPFGCKVEKGVPYVILFVSELKKVFIDTERLRPYQFRQCFETQLIIGFRHEMDHLRSDRMSAINDNLSKVIEDESAVWALTCENTMTPLVELYGRELLGSNQQSYLAWLQAGRNAESQSWKAFIAGLYGNFKRG